MTKKKSSFSLSGNKKIPDRKLWLALISLPFALLMFVAGAQIIVHYIINQASSQGVSNHLTSALNIMSVIIGLTAIVALLCVPLWIYQLIKKSNIRQRSKTVAIILAVFFSIFTWLYTYQKDYKKFWINLGLLIVTLGYWQLAAWVWAVVDTVMKPDSFYEKY